jgi:hypothetical protein
MEIDEKMFREFVDKMDKHFIDKSDLIMVIETLSELANDNGFDKEGFFDEIIYLLEEIKE